MPQASDQDRARYMARFGDIGCEHAVKALTARGWRLKRDWTWVKPKHRKRKPTEEELFWIGFLISEWDFGGIV